MIHPITFSIPAEKIVHSCPPKTRMLAHIIPGKLDTYIYKNETDYYNGYKESVFAITKKKAGWDCMRHYEIMANGCIPVFQDIERCPPRTMALLPKDLFVEGNALYSKIGTKQLAHLTSEETAEYTQLIHKLLDYTRTYVTTVSLAQYVLDKSLHPDAKRVLYLSGQTSPDYLRCITLHGFKSLLGAACHDSPRIPHIYKMKNYNYADLYGKGITYTNLLDAINHDSSQNVVELIKEKYYDIVIYGSYHRGMPHYDLVKSIYSPNQVIFLCGEDEHPCNYRRLVDAGHTVFVRELM
jgi:hypothetical protein